MEDGKELYQGDITYTGARDGRSADKDARMHPANAASVSDAFIVEHPIGLDVVLMTGAGRMQRLFLPYPPKGRYEFAGIAPLRLYPSGSGWAARGTQPGTVRSDLSSDGEEFLLNNRSLLSLYFGEEEYVLYPEEVNHESYSFHNYIALEDTVITIGRSADNDIVYQGQMVSRHHARLISSGGVWIVEDLGSLNGVYINDQRVFKERLKTGDRLYVMGLQIIIGRGFLSVNDGNHRLQMSMEKLIRVTDTDSIRPRILPDKGRKKDAIFNRLPRRLRPMDADPIEIDSPPIAVSAEKIPMMMRMGSSMVMGSTAALTGNVAMLASSLLLPVLSQQYTKEDREDYEKRRVAKYHEYLDQKWQDILTEKEKEEAALRWNYPPLADVLGYTRQKDRLWERRKTDDDFLTLRLGAGSLPLKAEISCMKKQFEIDHDPLMDEMYDMVEEKIRLENVPILLDLKENCVTGILGKREDEIAFIRAMIIRIAHLYSYDEVKLLFLLDEDELEALSFIASIPHVFDDERTVRYIATTVQETYMIGDSVAETLGTDLDKPAKLEDMLKKHPYYIVIALNKHLFDSMEVLKKALQQEKTCGISVITVFDDLPKETSVLIRLGTENSVLYLKEPGRDEDVFKVDEYSSKKAQESVRKLSNTSLRTLTQAYALPKTLTFMEMYGAGKIEHLDIRRRWQNNNPVTSLAVPVGVGTDGSLFYLDLHQRAQGPHGLVAGTTGSGKSEFLLTYILSLALNFHPDEVAFLLIDYKGGGLTGAFDDPANGIHLPHLIGTITNLDGSAINRSLVSLQSEMKRRQRVFNEAKSATGEGTMDIYTYQRLCRNGKVKEPMPHLFIISDEFAELKQQQPEFLDALVSIARIGRSLGVHLILATQKPAGVVTEQIISNTRFRVCLKVAEKADSTDMLKRPDAAYLRETGRFYLQVGNDELFALGQSGWSGAEYEPSEEVVRNLDDSIEVIDHTGNTVLEVRREKKKSGSGRSQLVEIVRSICDAGEEMHLEQRSMWLPPLERKIDAAELQREDEWDEKTVTACIGRIDDPANQAQHLLSLNLETLNHLLIFGEPGSGKTTLIQTLLHSLVSRYTPNKVNFYILDYSSRLLRLFGKLPHCGVVMTDEDDDKLDSFFKLVNGIVEERKQLFSELEVDSYEAACKVREIPLILVVIDNFSGLSVSRKGAKITEFLSGYIKQSTSYGIRYIVTASHLNEVYSRVKQELSGRIALHMKDKYDFSEALQCKVPYVTMDLPGRGLYVYRGVPLECQLSMFEPGKEDSARLNDLKEEIDRITQGYRGSVTARRMMQISETETYEEFCGSFKGGRIPLGRYLKDGASIALPMKQFSMLSLYFGNEESICPVLDNILYAAGREEASVLFLKSLEGSRVSDLKHMGNGFKLQPDETGVGQLYVTLLDQIKKRDVPFQTYCREKELDTTRRDIWQDTYDYMRSQVRPIFVILERFTDLKKLTANMESPLKVFSSIFLLARRYQIYLFGCFYPEDEQLVFGDQLFQAFNPDKLCMLFGGMLSKQKLVQLKGELGNVEKSTSYNRCVVNYRNEQYPLLMPCGPKEEAVLAEDDRPIFG